MIAIYGFFLGCSPPSSSENYRFRETSPFKMWNFWWSLFRFSGSTPRWTPKNALTSGSGPGLLLGDEAICCPSKVSVFLQKKCVTHRLVVNVYDFKIFIEACVCAYSIYIHVTCTYLYELDSHTFKTLRFGQLKTNSTNLSKLPTLRPSGRSFLRESLTESNIECKTYPCDISLLGDISNHYLN